MTKITIELKNIRYQFPDTKTPVFTNLNFGLIDMIDNQNGCLYGIIGPSGVGKTTLLSIIGGQLKPDSGQVLVNGKDIYDMYDIERREMLAYQMQTSTNIRGNVRNNLIFGIYSKDSEPIQLDTILIDLLKKVGLWTIFEDKEGLDTIIGEGGLNLSGGQRQRLNFASLFLRSKFYKPLIILIDEPTASLDEISEIEITKLINDLSKSSVVLVVAHRLVTIANAKGIVDMSNVTDKTVVPLSKRDLLLSSQYYQDLNSNRIKLDE
ncbi:MAG: ATP-binding cassette domain-containing protein [Patescibacteria group bacterium]